MPLAQRLTNFGAFCAIFCLLATAAAQFQTFSPIGQSDVTYSIHVPADTATSNSGPIYFQINATRPFRWVALGQGNDMAGANIFVVYSDASGDHVTVSPRLGKGDIQPLYNPDANITVMDGSGIKDGVLTANVRCDTCLHWDGGVLDPADQASPWMWAVKYGHPLKSDSLSATITEHDDKGIQKVDLMKATGSNAANPFAALSASSTVASPSGSQAGGAPSIDAESFDKMVVAHAVLMIIAFVILFPFSALTLYLFPSFGVMMAHAPLQLFTLILAVAGMGLGITMARSSSQLSENHSIIGIAVVSWMIIFQPGIGYLHHRYFRKTGRKSCFAYLHRWSGRAVIVLGAVNVGLGFKLSGIGDGNPKGAVIAYGVVAGVFAVAYIVVVVFVR